MIKILSEFIANQIAAGEVVQRPESVIKELVENSLDAGADTIGVFIKNAGKTLIHIVDNGGGMSKDDLLLAPLRHSTSKILSSEDLDEIKTFGFRGEALASISSVSLLEIKTRQTDNEHGWKLISEPQKEFVLEPDNINIGTQIFVRNLFYNVPARRKFLKANTTEFKYIQETMFKLAMSYPEKRFTFYADNQLIFDLKPENLEERIISLLGESIAGGKLLKVDSTFDKIKIYGYIGQPQFATTTNVAQYFFLNKRSIMSKNLTYAATSAFEHLADKKFKPVFVLNIEADYKSVDVNVHPQKSEIKFEDEKLIFTCVKKAIFDALKLNNLVPDFNQGISVYEPLNYINSSGNPETIVVDKITGEILDEKKIINIPNYKPSYSSRNSYAESDRKENYYSQSNKAVTRSAFDFLYANDNDTTNDNENKFINSFSASNIKTADLSSASFWQFHNKYIFIETATGMLVIDQHNAHERTIYEQMLIKYKSNNSEKQSLLFPIELPLSNMQVRAIKEVENELMCIGFGFEILSSGIIITAQPNDLHISAIEQTFIEIIDEYISNDELKYTAKQDKLIATIACKAAIKAGKNLSFEEMKELATNLFKCNLPYICPHGRPVVIEYSVADFDKKFGRIQ